MGLGIGYRLTPLHITAWKGHLAVMEALLQGGADVNQAETDDGYTPLIMAAEMGNLTVVEALLERGAFIDVATHDGCTALDMAHIVDAGAVAARLQAVLDARTDARAGRAHVFFTAIEAGSLPAPLAQWVPLLPIAARAELAASVSGALDAERRCFAGLFDGVPVDYMLSRQTEVEGPVAEVLASMSVFQLAATRKLLRELELYMRALSEAEFGRI